MFPAQDVGGNTAQNSWMLPKTEVSESSTDEQDFFKALEVFPFQLSPQTASLLDSSPDLMLIIW